MLAACVSLTALAPSASAYVHTKTSQGLTLRWTGNPKVNFVGNPVNRSGITSDGFSSSVIASLEKWKKASAGAVDFDYWQGTDFSDYPANSTFNGSSSIYFASNQQSGNPIDTNVIGITQVWYDTRTGEVIETDVALNDVNFVFTKNPQDSTSGIAGINRRVFIDSILVHELGHAYGMGHAQNLQSTMVHAEYFDQSYLSCDEWAGIRSIYGNANAKGAISGKITAPNGSPVFGAFVNAVSIARGVILASAITQSDGSFRIDSLEPGAYSLISEPYGSTGATLPSYYASINPKICSGNAFVRTAYASADGTPNIYSLAANQELNAGTLSVKCSAENSTVARQQLGSTAFNGAPTVLASASSQFAFLDRFANTDSELFYKIDVNSAKLTLHALSHTLYSPIRVQVRLLDSFGNTVPSQVRQPVYSSETTFQNYDLLLTAEGLTPGSYVIRVTAQGLSAFQFPAQARSVDTNPFFLITGTTGNAVPSLAGVLPDNAKCRADLGSSTYRSPGGVPPKGKGSVEAGSACGTVSERERGEDFGRNTFFNWVLCWMAMGAGYMGVARSRKTR